MEQNDFLYNGMINGVRKGICPPEMVEIAERLERCHYIADEIKMDISDLVHAEDPQQSSYSGLLCAAINNMICARNAIYDAYCVYRRALQILIATGGVKNDD